MIYPLPLLGVRDLATWLSLNKADILPEGYADITWHGSGAAALAAVCSKLIADTNRSIEVWLPAYFCGQSLRYLREQALNIHFYPLTADKLPDYKAIQNDVVKTGIDLFIHVHYFGNVSGQIQSRTFANEHGAMLLEDCAHVISPLSLKKCVGDYLVFSPHKHFPLPRIGLIINRKPIGETGVGSSARIPLKWFMLQVLRRWLPRAQGASWGRKWSANTAKYVDSSPSSLAIQITQRSLTDFMPAAKARYTHVTRLKTTLEKINGWSQLLDDEVTVPYLFGMICDTPEQSRRRFELLNQRVQLVMQWPDLPVEIKNSPELAEQCSEWVERSLFFFVHQQLDTEMWIEEIELALQIEGF